jgi:hypothetical protein
VARDAPPRPSEFVYISERKLLALARARGVSTAWFERHLALEGSGRLSLPLAPGTGVSARATAGVERVQPDQQEHAVERLLDKVVRELRRDGVADLDAETGTFTEGSWFRFHRRLRFGVASGEYDPDLRALVLVDREAVEEYSLVPGLLMFGSPEHLNPPYRSGRLERSPGARTGSSTGTLFRWLQTTRKSLEADPQADLNELQDGLSLESQDAPHIMYSVLARHDWMGNPGLPQLLDRRPCEGLAEVSLIAADDHRTTVMATPLYVRVRQLPEPSGAIKGRGRSLRSLLPVPLRALGANALKQDVTLRRSSLEPAVGPAFLSAP